MVGSWHDLRAATRALLRSRRFAGVAILTLGVAIAVNAAMFAFISAVFLRPLPYEAPERLHDLRIDPAEAGPFDAPPVSLIAEALAPYGALAAYTERGFIVNVAAAGTENGASSFVSGAGADEHLFSVLGVTPVMGRMFTASDVSVGAAPTVVVSNRFWRTALESRGDVIGTEVRIDGREHTVIGVMAPRFAYPDFAMLWVADGIGSARIGEVQLLFRSRDAAAALAARQTLERVVSDRGASARVRLPDIRPRGGPLVAALLGAIGFVLLIACSNVANLVLARGTGRRHEIGLRAALGASRGVLLRYLSMEGLVIAIAAAALGTIGSVWLGDLIIAAIPADGLPVWFEMRIDARVLAWVGCLTLLTVLVSSTLPAITVTRRALGAVLAESGTRSVGDGSRRLRASLVSTQIALAMVLLAGAAILLRAFGAVHDIDTGSNADAVLEVRVQRAPRPDADAYARLAIERIGRLNGVDGAAAVSPGPAGRVEPVGSPDRALQPETEAVSAGFFETLTLPLVAGRPFMGEPGPQEAVLSESVASTLFGEATRAIGSVFAFPGEDGATYTVIGVVGDRRRAQPGAGGTVEVRRHVYVPLATGRNGDLRLLARAANGEPLHIAPAVSEAIRDIDRDAVIRAPRVLGDIERDPAANVQFFASVFAGFGAIAVGLALLGIWGVVAYTVSRRTREIGVRMTLGATESRVVRDIAGATMLPVGIGLAGGVVGAVAVGRLLQDVLFGVRPADPVSIGIVGLLFGSMALWAAWMPARRAARIDPLAALRRD